MSQTLRQPLLLGMMRLLDYPELAVGVCRAHGKVAVGQTFAAGLMASKCHLFRANGQAYPRHYREPAIYG